MANFGGGAEEHARFKQYEYKANSSLVLNNSRKKKEREVADGSKRPRLWEASVLTDTDDGVYQPKSKETRAAYEAMLSLIQHQLGELPPSILYGAAYEILAILKNESVKNPEKKMEIEKLLNPSNLIHVFDQLVSIGKQITDYQEGGDEGLDYDVGVGVEFEEHEEDDDEESDLDMVQEEEEDGEIRTGGVQVSVAISGKDAGHAKEDTSLNVEEIDAHWLQRKLVYEEQIDPHECQVLAEELLEILGESKLFVHLRFEKLSLVKFLLHNRLKVVWCTRLARARDQEERNQIVEEMMELGPELAAIAEELHAKRSTAK